MKKVLLVLLAAVTLSIAPVANASVGNSNPIHEEVLLGYEVGYTIDEQTVLGQDMRMWNFKGLVPGWYVAYSLDQDNYYYISQDAAIEFLERK